MFLSFVLAPLLVGAQNGVVINELQAANRKTHVALDGSTPDWVELFNPTSTVVDITGMRFAVVGRTHVIDGSLTIAPGEHRIIWFDGHDLVEVRNGLEAHMTRCDGFKLFFLPGIGIINF